MKAVRILFNELDGVISPAARAVVALVFIVLLSPAASQNLSLGGDDPEPFRHSAKGAAEPTPVLDLLREAEVSNPEILAAQYGWRAANHVAQQVSSLPDPQITIQQLSVGSPRPFAGFSNSDFAYVGIGASQDIPYPGKLRLRAAAADREADGLREEAEVVRRQVIEQVKVTYFRLAYVQQTREILERNQQLLQQTERVAESHYRVGQGSQQEVLKAQLQSTRILRELVMRHQELGQLEAQLKQLLGRPQASASIVTEKLSFQPLRLSSEELLARVEAGNPQLRAQSQMLNKQKVQLQIATRDARPDFNVQYMYQRTGNRFRDYYMLSLGVRIPRRARQRAEVAEATEQIEKSRRQYESQSQQIMADTQSQYLMAEADAEQLKIYSEGLIPQAEAMLRAGTAAYEVNRQNFETLLSYFADVLTLQLEQQKLLAEYNIAIAALETRTGEALQ